MIYLEKIYNLFSLQVFAAMVSLVNAKRLTAGKSSLGWINPSLYSLATSFLLNDITTGNNTCVGRYPSDIPTAPHYFCCEQGFSAAPGWDPATGLGSVNYTAFEIAFFALGDTVPPPPPSGGSSGSDQLSAGAIAGIVIGAVAFVAIVGGLVYFFCFAAPYAPVSSPAPAALRKNVLPVFRGKN